MPLTPEQRERAIRIRMTAQEALGLVIGKRPDSRGIFELSAEEMVDVIATLLYAAGLAAHIGSINDEAFVGSAAIDGLRASRKHAEELISAGLETHGNA